MTMASGVLARLRRAPASVKAAHHDRHAAAAILGGDLVGAPGGVGLDADRHQVRRLVVRDRLHAIVVEADLDVASGVSPARVAGASGSICQVRM